MEAYMRKRFGLLLLVCSTFLLTGCELNGLLLVSGPAIQHFGFAQSGRAMGIENNSPAFCRVTDGSQTIVFLGPGNVAYDRILWADTNYEIPFAAFCYKDANFSDYVGGVSYRMPLNYQDQRPVFWRISLGDLRAPNGYSAVTLPLPERVTPASLRIKMHFHGTNGGTRVLIANGSSKNVLIRLDGLVIPGCATVNPRNTCAFFLPANSRYSSTTYVEVLALNQNGGFAGSFSQEIYSQVQSARAEVFFLTDPDFR